jgi:exonuclease III
MSQKNCDILCWNVRGLNAAARRDSIRNMVATSGATIVCLQETKLAVWTTKLIRDTLGPSFVNNYITLPAIGVRGGILLAANEQFFSL